MRIRLGENFRAVFYAPFYAAHALEFYTREGIEVELLSSSTPGEGVSALSEGKLDVTWGELGARLTLDSGFLGGGYGKATAAGDRAIELAKGEGLVLDPTYTAKAFAAALDRVESGRFARVLYWHTLSSAPLEPMLAGAAPLPPELDRLFTED